MTASLLESYADLTSIADGLAPADLDRPTRASGWTVRDLLFHLLLDAQRALVTLASPADRAPDRDRYDYWHSFRPDLDDPSTGSGGSGGAAHADLVRRVAPAYGDPALLALWRDTATAAGQAVDAADPDDLVATQGHVLSVADLRSTLVVEACVHHLDLMMDLGGAPGPSAAPLTETRSVLDVLLGSPFPGTWDDARVVLVGTGREAATAPERAALGDAAGRLPLLG